jgi:hypothetical protein
MFEYELEYWNTVLFAEGVKGVRDIVRIYNTTNVLSIVRLVSDPRIFRRLRRRPRHLDHPRTHEGFCERASRITLIYTQWVMNGALYLCLQRQICTTKCMPPQHDLSSSLHVNAPRADFQPRFASFLIFDDVYVSPK